MFAQRKSLFAKRLSMQSVARTLMSPDDTERRAAEDYARIMLRYAELDCNPVLELLAEVEHFEFNHKYPSEPLSFAEDHWRAYYHGHISPISVNGEHGHFHFFARIGNSGIKAQDWAHVAGLSIDAYGQPLMWFTVNQWVTGDAWLPAEELFEKLVFSPLVEGESLLNRWAMSLLSLSRNELRELLMFRDQRVVSLQEKNPDETVLQSRSVYELSSRSMDLMGKLSTILPG